MLEGGPCRGVVISTQCIPHAVTAQQAQVSRWSRYIPIGGLNCLGFFFIIYIYFCLIRHKHMFKTGYFISPKKKIKAMSGKAGKAHHSVSSLEWNRLDILSDRHARVMTKSKAGHTHAPRKGSE